ncbi:MAG: ATP-binding protein [Egibacteraceae bacterium]
MDKISISAKNRTRLPATYLDDKILLSETTAWAYFALPTVSYDFLGEARRIALAQGIAIALAGLRDAECHLIVVPREEQIADWAAALDRSVTCPSSGWPGYLAMLQDHLAEQDLTRRQVFLGVQLGRRRQSGLRNPWTLRVQRAAGVEDLAVREREIAEWHRRADSIRRVLGSGDLRARHATSEELRWLIQRCLHRGLASPPASATGGRRWGAGELEALAEGLLVNGHRMLRLEQPHGSRWLAFLALARFPELLPFPGGEWLYHFTMLDFPVEVSMRMRLLSAHRAAADVNRKLAEAYDQERHIAETGADVPLVLSEQLEGARTLDHQLKKSREPLVYAWPRLAITGVTPEELTDRAEQLIEQYRDQGIDCVWPTGDQLSLFMESLPGDRIRIKTYEQKQPVITIAGGMFIATSDLGDHNGPYIGQTTGPTRAAVHFDPLRAAQYDRPTAITITGEPGGGKALALDTPIPTPSGWTTMGQLRVGDDVFDERGRACRITHATDVRHGRSCFEVEFCDGAVIVADADHRWLTVTRSGAAVMTTAEIRDTLHVGHTVQLTQPLRYPEAALPIDPYAVGCCLSNPSTDQAEALAAIDDAGLGSIGIPRRYARASVEQRWSLLEGLMDTDGTCDSDGTCEFVVTSQRLAEDFLDLVAGLGFRATLGIRPAMLNGRTAFKVSFASHEKVFRAHHKLSRQRLDEAPAAPLVRSIIDVRPVPSVPVRCIAVDSPSHLYLASRACIPTHNTTVAELLAYQLALRGAWVDVIDPKGDTAALVDLPGLEKTRLLEVSSGDDGLLDPFSLADTPEQGASLAAETLRLLLPPDAGFSREGALLTMCQAVAEEPDPSLHKVVNQLLRHPDAEARDIGAMLGAVAGYPLARLCFAPHKRESLNPDEHLTVIQVAGLSLPEPGTRRQDQGWPERLSVAVMFLIADFIKRLAQRRDPRQPKAIIIDEAWVLTATLQGRQLIESLARMGRRHNTVVMLVSQNADDFLSEKVRNCVSTKFAFRSTDDAEVAAVLRLLGVEDTPSHAEEVRSLRNGECIFADLDGRVGTIAIDLVSTALLNAFDTTPRPLEDVAEIEASELERTW